MGGLCSPGVCYSPALFSYIVTYDSEKCNWFRPDSRNRFLSTKNLFRSNLAFGFPLGHNNSKWNLLSLQMILWAQKTNRFVGMLLFVFTLQYWMSRQIWMALPWVPVDLGQNDTFLIYVVSEGTEMRKDVFGSGVLCKFKCTSCSIVFLFIVGKWESGILKWESTCALARSNIIPLWWKHPYSNYRVWNEMLRWLSGTPFCLWLIQWIFTHYSTEGKDSAGNTCIATHCVWSSVTWDEKCHDISISLHSYCELINSQWRYYHNIYKM